MKTLLFSLSTTADDLMDDLEALDRIKHKLIRKPYGHQ